MGDGFLLLDWLIEYYLMHSVTSRVQTERVVCLVQVVVIVEFLSRQNVLVYQLLAIAKVCVVSQCFHNESKVVPFLDRLVLLGIMASHQDTDQCGQCS